MPPSYLKQRRKGWYVQLAVPRALQPVIGAKVLTRSLQTRDETEALRKRHKVIADLQSMLDAAAAAQQVPAGSPEALLRSAQANAAAVAAGLMTPEEAEEQTGFSVEHFLDSVARKHGVDEAGHPRLPSADVATIRRAHDVAAGRRDSALSALLAAHLKELRADAVLRPSTIAEKERRVQDFIAWFGVNRNWRDVRRSTAVDYLRNLKERQTGKDGKGPSLSRASVVKWLSDLRVFFRWILDAEDADTRPANPFDGLQPAKSVRGKQSARRPWEPEELSTFLHGVPADDPLWSLGALAAYSGARLEELAALRVESVEGESFVVTEGKRQASVRRVPVHPAVAPLVARLVETSRDGYLVPGLLPGGYDKKRGQLIGKRFGYTIRKLGIEDPRVVFHSLRNTVESRMIARGVPLERAQLIVGHESLGSSTPYVDRGSVQDVENRKALALVSYGEELDDYVRGAGATVVVETKSRRRPKRTPVR